MSDNKGNLSAFEMAKTILCVIGAGEPVSKCDGYEWVNK